MQIGRNMITDSSFHGSSQPLPSPAMLLQVLPADKKILSMVSHTRQAVQRIVTGDDKRLLVIIGPCSIHDAAAAFDYATQLHSAAQRWRNELMVIMRVYFEKPRTALGWKGFINDPLLTGDGDIALGLRLARQLLLQINTLGLATATEFLDNLVPHYLADLISWAAIGARTCESPLHRQLASALTMPVGFKNTTSGDIQAAIDAVCAAQHPHRCFGINPQGQLCEWQTPGNPATHVVLRGGKQGPNYSAQHRQQTVLALERAGLRPRLMVDCSHGNSGKDYRRQTQVIDHLCQALQQGDESIMGVMLESHLRAGSQAFVRGQALNYGQSITDECLGMEETVTVLEQLARAVRQRQQATVAA